VNSSDLSVGREEEEATEGPFELDSGYGMSSDEGVNSR